MHPVADGRGQRPAVAEVAEEILRDAAELVHLAVAAGEHELQHVVRQLLNGNLLGAEALQLGLVSHLHDVAAAQANRPRRCDEPRAAVAEAVQILFDGKLTGGLNVWADVLDLQTII